MSIDFMTARRVADPTDAHERRKPMVIDAEAPAQGRRYLAAIAVAAAVVLLAGGAWLWSRPPRIDGRLWTAAVRSGDLQVGVAGHGEVIPSALVTLSSATGGSVTTIHALSGAHLAKGDAVLTLRNPDLLAELGTAETTYAEKLAAQASLRAELDAKRSEMRSKLDDATDALSVKRLELEAQQTLFANGISSQLALQKERAQLAAAERQVRQARADVDNLEATSRMRMHAVDAELQTAAAQLARLRDQVDELTIRAPEAGTLYELTDKITVGTPVVAGAVLGRIATQATVSADLRIPSARAGEVRIGQTVELTVGPGKIQGRVQRIDPRVQQDQVQVSVALDERAATGLLAGQPANGEIVTASLRNVSYVERPAGVVDHASASVFEVDRAGNRLVRREVRYGGSGGKYIVIDSGLSAGSEIVLSDMARYAGHRSLRYSN
ncbi:MAG TPA: HlyD family efflux transporter periplasmic adaptor subunit [Thermoanaerobaculia bacterium]|nr:HlyD family efflux transporter periplasmic adaptor subunit [Thermoanaerobaculia bacterium]